MVKYGIESKARQANRVYANTNVATGCVCDNLKVVQYASDNRPTGDRGSEEPLLARGKG
jgi:hypothetical protein